MNGVCLRAHLSFQDLVKAAVVQVAVFKVIQWIVSPILAMFVASQVTNIYSNHHMFAYIHASSNTNTGSKYLLTFLLGVVMSQLEPMGEDIRGVLIHVVPLKLQAKLLSRNFGQMLVPLGVLFHSAFCPCLCVP